MDFRADRPRRKRGQAIIFLLFALVIVIFVVLWNFDLHRILHVKNVAQNGGDASAVMAARWQGISLNLVGDLNLVHALALSTSDQESADAITNVQARMLYVGPMVAFMASQQAAKQNGLFNNPDFTQAVLDHANRVRTEYPFAVGSDGEMLFPEPYPGCWEDYATMLEFIGEQGIVAGPDNAHFYGDATGGHVLYMIGFYEAVAGRNWCWFYLNAPALLESYREFFPCWWPPLPPIPRTRPRNSEIYGLGLTVHRTRLEGLLDLDTAQDYTEARQLPEGAINERGMTTEAAWYCYEDSVWSEWDAIDVAGPDRFPVVGPVVDAYNYAGADAAVRVEARADRLTPGHGGRTITNTLVWTAAAKPFGTLADGARPNDFSLVLPAFTDSRMIPVDASSAPAGGSYNLQWRIHIEQHLPIYMNEGPDALPDCHYCNQLRVWEVASFRQEGVDWLSQNSDQCIVRGGGGGGGGGGGTRRGH